MRWIIGIISFFVVVAGVNALLVYFAISSEKGLIEDRPYERGLQYQAVIDRLSNAKQSGLLPQVSIGVRDDKNQRRVEVSVNDQNGKPVSGLKVQFLARYPASSNDDARSELIENAPGEYAAVMPLRPGGRWLVELSVLRSDEELLWKTSAFAPMP